MYDVFSIISHGQGIYTYREFQFCFQIKPFSPNFDVLKLHFFFNFNLKKRALW